MKVSADIGTFFRDFEKVKVSTVCDIGTDKMMVVKIWLVFLVFLSGVSFNLN